MIMMLAMMPLSNIYVLLLAFHVSRTPPPHLKCNRSCFDDDDDIENHISSSVIGVSRKINDIL